MIYLKPINAWKLMKWNLIGLIQSLFEIVAPIGVQNRLVFLLNHAITAGCLRFIHTFVSLFYQIELLQTFPELRNHSEFFEDFVSEHETYWKLLSFQMQRASILLELKILRLTLWYTKIYLKILWLQVFDLHINQERIRIL